MRQMCPLRLSACVLLNSPTRPGKRSDLKFSVRLRSTETTVPWSRTKLRHIASDNLLMKTTLSPINTRAPSGLFIQGGHGRLKSNVASGEQDLGPPLPYTAIPGPRPLPVIGNKFLFTSLGGYPMERFWDSSWKLYNKFGPIVRVTKFAGDLDMVIVFRPEDTAKIYQAEGRLPVRPGLDILTYYRASRPSWFSSPGLVPGNGSEWRRLRSAVHALLRPEVVSRYRAAQNKVAEDLVCLLTARYPLQEGPEGGSHVVPDLLPLLFHYTLEAVGVVSLGTRLGCLHPDAHDHQGHHDLSSTRASRVITANQNILELLGESMFSPPFYKYFPSRMYRRLSYAQDTIAGIVQEELMLRQEERAQDPEAFSFHHPFLDSLFSNSQLPTMDVFLLLVEIFQGGIDATATTLGFCVYFLARDQRAQHLLYQEVKDVDPAVHNLQGLVYLRAVVQETLRLRPSASSRSRLIQQDMVFSGYLVPAGTFVTSPPVVACHDPQVFPQPDVFWPERWLSTYSRTTSSTHTTPTQDPPPAHHNTPTQNPPPVHHNTPTQNPPPVHHNTSTQDPPPAHHNTPTQDPPPAQESQEDASGKRIHPYTIVAFGHGARMCPGRRLAELEIKVALVQLVKNFKMETDRSSEGHIGQVMRLNMMPDKNLAVSFTPRQE